MGGIKIRYKMKNTYIFRQIKKEELPAFFDIILSRMKWMDEVGIKQWNVTKYDEVYPLSYYEEKRQAGQLFVLEKVETGEIVCGAVLKEHDERWEDDPPAIYLRNFATRLDSKGVGILFMEYAEKYAVSCNKEYFRLDSADDNIPLAKYYENLGFVSVGSCVDGAYSGILRQKKLK